MNNIDQSSHGWKRSDVSYYHQDALGSVVMLTGSHGHVEERYDYDAYGNPYNGKFTQGNSYGFTGQRYEAELSAYSFAYRTYNPVSMRWMTLDPVRDGMNWYAYVNGDPINLWDPLGLHWAGGAKIEYPEDFDPDDISLENAVEESKQHMDYVTGEEVKDFVQAAVQSTAKEHYAEVYTENKLLKETVSYIPPDFSFAELVSSFTQDPRFIAMADVLDKVNASLTYMYNNEDEMLEIDQLYNVIDNEIKNENEC